MEGGDHPDRDAQFQHINRQVKAFQRQGQPVVSVDTKKKELVGEFKQRRTGMATQGQPEEVQVHDFIDKELGKAIPYGVYDLTANAGLGQRGRRSRHGRVRRRRRSGGGGTDGAPGLPGGEGAADHGRRRRQQREPLPAVEGGTAGLADETGSAHLGVPLPAGDEQVEQDRAPDVLPHHRELAGPPAGEP